MKYHHTSYVYRIKYPRTGDWWVGHWKILSDWCNDMYGTGNWEYINESFAFLTEEDKMWFKLKWSKTTAITG